MRTLQKICGVILVLWAAQATPAASRTACSAMLPDGRSFATGGSGPEGQLASARFFGPKARVTEAAPMLAARAGHICVALADGSVLVAGGETGDGGVTNAAEVFHPDSNSWTPTGAMMTARVLAAAVRLADGRVLVSGGVVNGRPAHTLEIYETASGRFEQVTGVLSAARSGHSVVLLEDGRVVVAGGFEGRRVLQSIDLYDPVLGALVPGGRMAVARANFAAARLPDGRVLFAGGTNGEAELDSAEIYDPAAGGSTALERGIAAARQGALAIGMPGNGQILIAGGSAAGKPLDSAEFFLPARQAFEPAGEAVEGADASTITVAPMLPGASFGAARIYSAPTLRGVASAEAIHISGGGWKPGEEVRIGIHAAPGRPALVEGGATADAAGRIAAAVAAPVGAAYVIARGIGHEAIFRLAR